MAIRIIAGQWRGRPLATPEGLGTRPTTDRVREALFSMLVSRLGSFEGLNVADLFAGSGALGLEALSRGAARCTFVERDPGALASIKANITNLTADADIKPQNAESYRGGPHDLVFLDPPYDSGLGHKALAAIRIASGGWASLETAPRETVAIEGYEKEAERIYGKSKVTLLRRF